MLVRDSSVKYGVEMTEMSMHLKKEWTHVVQEIERLDKEINIYWSTVVVRSRPAQPEVLSHLLVRLGLDDDMFLYYVCMQVIIC